MTSQAFVRPLVPECDSNYCCVICHDLCHMPTSCPSCMSALYCSSCITEWLQKNKKCPTCIKPWNTIIPNRFAQAVIDKCKATCAHCKTVTAEYGTVVQHMQNCDAKLISCVNVKHGCAMVMKKVQMVEHVQECGFERIACTCKKEYLRRDKQIHVKSCVDAIIECILGCGDNLARKAMDKHKLVCPKRSISCKHKDLGCKWTGTAQEEQSHVGKCAIEPLKEVFANLFGIIAQQQKKIDALEGKLNDLEKQNANGTYVPPMYKQQQATPCKEEATTKHSRPTSTSTNPFASNRRRTLFDDDNDDSTGIKVESTYNYQANKKPAVTAAHVAQLMGKNVTAKLETIRSALQHKGYDTTNLNQVISTSHEFNLFADAQNNILVRRLPNTTPLHASFYS